MTKVRVFKRDNVKRDIRHLVSGETVRTSIGGVSPGMEVFGLTNGQFSFINVIEYLLEQIGPSKVDISTWVAAAYDLKHLDGFLENKEIRKIRFLVDRSFPNRQPVFFSKVARLFRGRLR